MDFQISLLIVAIVLTTCLALDPLSVQFNQTGPIKVRAGAENINMECTVNRGVMYLLKNKAVIVHKNAEGKETEMSSGGTLENAPPSFYKVDVHMIGSDEMRVDFKILTVRPEDDGTFFCRVQTAGGVVSAEAVLEVVVVKNFATLKLKFGNEEPITKSIEDPLEIDTGKYNVMCTAEGSNPGSPNVGIFMDGKHILSSKPNMTEMTPVKQRLFQTSISSSIDVVLATSGKKVECRAQSPGDGGSQLTVSLPLSVNIYEPEVKCNETIAYVGEEAPVLTCMVNHSAISVISYKFQIGQSGEIIEDNSTDAATIKTEKLSDELVMVTLILSKSESHHFDDHIYLLIENSDGHVTKTRVDLVQGQEDSGEEEDPSDFGGKTQISAAALIFSVLCSILYRTL